MRFIFQIGFWRMNRWSLSNGWIDSPRSNPARLPLAWAAPWPKLASRRWTGAEISPELMWRRDGGPGSHPRDESHPRCLALLEPCWRFGGALVEPWWRFRVALGSQSVGYQLALRWPWGGLGVALGGFAARGSKFEVGSSKFGVHHKHSEYNPHFPPPSGWSGGALDIPWYHPIPIAPPSIPHF